MATRKIKMKRYFLLLVSITIFAANIGAQQPTKPNSGEIYKAIERLNFLGNVLYVAAHPDDENTRVISHFVNGANAHSTYLSLTRGDGGQNLIGSEIEELLGVIRTQELLMARKVDGGHQMFSRANDFGFSKNAEETISIWDNELVKQDVVWAIRKTRPDVIINRFDHRTSGKTHGHHTASAMLTEELFEKAADANIYSDQLKFVSPWQAKRLFFNVSWFFFGSQEAFAKADKTKFLSFDAGEYYPLLGKSNSEISALSRSNHKCQGFGSTGSRGRDMEYLELIKGDMPLDKENIFEGINTTWTRVEGGDKIKTILDQVQKEYDFKAPNKSVPKLIEALSLIEQLQDQFWRDRKVTEIKNVIASCLGLYIDATTTTHTVTPGEKIKIDIELTKRLNGHATLHSFKFKPNGLDTMVSVVLENNTPFKFTGNFEIPPTASPTNCYWLNEKGSLGMYKVDKQEWIGLPETPKQIKVGFTLLIDGKDVYFEKDVSYRYNSPEDGETYRPLEVTPEIFVSVDEKVYVFGDESTKKIRVKVKAGSNNQKGQVSLPVANGWKVTPAFHEFEIKDKLDSREFIFEITPPMEKSELTITPVATANGKTYNKQLIEIKYGHIPMQMVLLPSESKLVKLDIQKVGFNVAYIKGAGDEVAQSLRQIGYRVTEIEAKDINNDNLKSYDAVITGVRAYNTDEDLKFKQDIIFDYVNNGGNFIVQYNTNNRLVVGEKLAPYLIKIGRERVTVEDSPVTFLQPEHEVLQSPNKITQDDFKGWVQERGLYFASEWGPEFTPILSCNDPGEPARDGGLLIAKYGKGNYIYTGYSWFRELPAGVPGAFRLFANMISLGREDKP